MICGEINTQLNFMSIIVFVLFKMHVFDLLKIGDSTTILYFFDLEIDHGTWQNITNTEDTYLEMG